MREKADRRQAGGTCQVSANTILANDFDAVCRGFQFVYEKDKSTYSGALTQTTSVKDSVNTFQQEVDDLIRATELDLSTTVATTTSAASRDDSALPHPPSAAICGASAGASSA